MRFPCVVRLATVSAVVVLGAGCSAPSLTGRTAPPQGGLPTTASTDTSTTAIATTPAEVTTTLTEVVALPFTTSTVDDPALLKGAKAIRTSGRAGQKIVTWLVRIRDGVEVGRSVSAEQVTMPPEDEVVAVGVAVPAPAPVAPAAPKSTAPAPKPAPSPTTPGSGAGRCDPNYSACVPIASDVDCAGGKGNGPAYVQGPVRVIGTDIYGLDADHDGIGCE
jgi:hypothetical protein